MLTYANFGEGFMTDYCTSCHDSAKSGGDRSGAPSGTDFDSLDLVKSFSGRIKSRAGNGSTMPPFDPRPVAQERADLTEWLDCGAP